VSRRKPHKPRRQRPASTGKVTLRIERAPGVSVEIVLPGYTSGQYRQAQARAQAGDYRAPELWQLVEAMSAAIGHDLDASLWGDADFLKFLAYVGLVDETEWGAADDAALAKLLRGEGAS